MKLFTRTSPTQTSLFRASVMAFLLAASVDHQAAVNSTVTSIPAFDASQGFTLQLPAIPGMGYLVEASSDCQNWSEMFRGIADTNVISCNDVMSTILPARFYRTVAVQSPSNDNLAQSTQLIGPEASATGFNINGTSEPGEPEHANLETGHNSVWWSWIAPASGPVFITTVGTFFDTLIAVYTGDTVSNLVSVAKKDIHTREVTFRASAGTRYQIAVAGRSGEYGIIKLYLKQDPSLSISSLPTLARQTIVLTDDDYPDVPQTLISFDDKGTNWVQTTAGQVAASGTILAYSATGPSTLLRLNSTSDGTVHVVEFTLNSPSAASGAYVYTVDGQPGRSGQFLKLKSSPNQLAPPSLAGLHLIGTRVWTTTGTSGQSHHYTFSPNNTYHDTDNDEQAAGSYAYIANGSTAQLVLDYKGPSWFVGDHHELQLAFTSAVDGTFTSHYAKNDGTKIDIIGTFTLGQE